MDYGHRTIICMNNDIIGAARALMLIPCLLPCIPSVTTDCRGTGTSDGETLRLMCSSLHYHEDRGYADQETTLSKVKYR